MTTPTPPDPSPTSPLEARYRRQQASLLELTRRDAGASAGKDALHHILEVTARALAVERVGVWHYTDDRQAIVCTSLYDQGTDQHSSGVELRAADYPAYFRALATEEVIAADDARADPRTAEFRDGYLVPLGITSMLDVPLRSAGRLGGVLCHEHRGPPRHWEADEQVFAMAVGNLVALSEEEAERRRGRAQLIDAIESLDAGFAMYGPDERLVVCNQRFRELYAAAGAVLGPGARYEDILRTYCAAVGRSPGSGSVEEWVARRLAEFRRPGAPIERELAGRWVRIADRKTSEGGLVSLRTDVTVLRRAREGAEAANRAKGEFLANMSHEVRTPMNGVLGMLDLALGTSLTAEQRDYLQTARSSGEALLTVINDILDFSKIEAGKLDLDPRPFTLRDGLADALRPLAARADAKGIELALQVDPAVPEVLVGDDGRLRQVLVNLAGNAVKFTDRGEVVVRVRAEPRGDEVVLHLAISDTGPGIPPGRLGAIFEPFSQADNSISRRFGGTGLGLTISRRLAALMHGGLWAESELGRGSTFHFTARLGRAATALALAPALFPSGTRALLAVANSTTRGLLAEELCRWGLSLGQATSWEEALARLGAAQAEPFAVLVLDSGLLGPRGHDQLAELTALSRPPAVVLLARAGEPGVEHWRGQVAATITRPIRSRHLRIALEAALAGPGRPGPSELALSDALSPAHPARVLLAEDNPVNQRVASRMLEKMGHSVRLAANGHEALAAMEAERFDVVLMDVQMPGLDGLQAAAEWRRREQGTGTRVPILALTAHAMKGDRERCLGAGMDGYLSKPIQPAELRQAIENLLARRQEAIGPRAVPPATCVFDRAALLANLGGDEALLAELSRMFFADSSRLMAEARQALSEGSAQKLAGAAHSLKGALGTLSAPVAHAAAGRLEDEARRGELAAAAESLRQLEMALLRLAEALLQPG